jgi:hypothetical protein
MFGRTVTNLPEDEWHLLFSGQPNQLFPHFELFFPQNLGERRRSRRVRDFDKLGSVHARTFLAFSLSQLGFNASGQVCRGWFSAAQSGVSSMNIEVDLVAIAHPLP